MGPLRGVRVLDLTRLLPGPFATTILANLGAQVLKVEPPDGGDYARWMPPLNSEQGTFFASLNHNKRSITLNLKNPDAQKIYWRLIQQYDVVVEQFRPGVMQRLGIGYEQARERFPQVIYVSLSGYGQDGPHRQRAGHDLNYIALAGVLGISGSIEGMPTVPGVQLADISGAIYAALGALAAVVQRQSSAQGDHVDVSLAESALSLVSPYLDEAYLRQQAPGPGDMMLNGLHPCYNIYRTADDRFMALGALEPKFFRPFVELVNRPDLADDGMATGERAEQVKAELQAIFSSRTQDEWIELLRDHDVCCEPVLDLKQVPTHELWSGRQAISSIEHPSEGTLHGAYGAVRFASHQRPSIAPSPSLGEHTDQVLAQLGFEPEQIAKLRQDGAI
ncbi:MAG: CaiB/BaiF CoA-transferase family protein [Candidatus Alcyoniella australis]|nr:CaiB/BaiF CoA-transferase family protein [Candidatus Alcyoniella australis]